MSLENNVSSEVSLKEIISKFKYWIAYLKSKRLIIAVVVLLGGALGLGYSFLRKPSYIADCTFVLEESGMKGSLGQYASMASLVGIDLGGADNSGLFSGENILELYKSRNMLVKTLLSRYKFADKEDLIVNRYINSYRLRQNWSDEPKLKNLNYTGAKNLTIVQDSILTEIAKYIDKKILTVSKPDKKLSIIQVEVRSIDEQFSKAFNDQIVKNVNDFYIETKTKKSLGNINVLQHQTDSVRRELNGALSSVASINDFNPNPNVSRQILKVPAQKRQIDAEANKAILTELVKTLEMSKVSLRKEIPLIQIIDQPVLPLEKVKINKLIATFVGMFLSYLFIITILLSRKIFRDITA